jgi:hypothetical protein
MGEASLMERTYSALNHTCCGPVMIQTNQAIYCLPIKQTFPTTSLDLPNEAAKQYCQEILHLNN